jgi:betaine-aldehyde dehydrogenase
LELGGKSAAIVLDDAELTSAAPFLGAGIFFASGQACVALSRVLAPRRRYDEVVEVLAAQARAQNVGDPFDSATTMGPLVSSRQRERVEGYVAEGLSAGAQLVVGGRRPADLDRGFFIEPTVFAQVDNSMRIAREEIFGPVVSVIPYSTLEEAIVVANDSPYGLGGAVFTSDPVQGLEVAKRVRTGTFAINAYGHTASVPFGGVKASGIGREHGPEGVEEFLEYKAITIPDSVAELYERS